MGEKGRAGMGGDVRFELGAESPPQRGWEEDRRFELGAGVGKQAAISSVNPQILSPKAQALKP